MKLPSILRWFHKSKHGALRGDIAIIGSGSWATALAKVVLENEDRIWWYIRDERTVTEFRRTRHNPRYLNSVQFDVDNINFSTDINEVVERCGILILVTPSPYLRDLLMQINVPLKDKFLAVATKGIVPGDNVVWSHFLRNTLGVPENQIAVLSGPSHAEEVARSRQTFLTVGCTDDSKAESLAAIIRCDYVTPILSRDVDGIEYAGVLKNVYALCSGICIGLKNGDNFQAVLVANAVTEMRHILYHLLPIRRRVSDSVYLGDLLVTCFSQFSRNRLFGTMIGRGYSVKAAQMEMSMIAEGYYGAQCMCEICKAEGVEAPILETVHAILYDGADPATAIAELSQKLR